MKFLNQNHTFVKNEAMIDGGWGGGYSEVFSEMRKKTDEQDKKIKALEDKLEKQNKQQIKSEVIF